MHVLPVIDLLRGQVVHGRAGQRHLYQPVQSVLTRESSPSAVAAAFREQLGLTQIYVADLDAIEHAKPSWNDYDQIMAQCVSIWLDAGVTEVALCRKLSQRYGAALNIVVGLETLRSRDDLSMLLGVLGPERIVVSLDLMNGRPRTRVDRWAQRSSVDIASELGRLGVRRWILLDVSRVGTGQGTGTRELSRALRREHADWELTCGGGIATLADIAALADDGVDGVLLASTLHDGRIGAGQIASLRASR